MGNTFKEKKIGETKKSAKKYKFKFVKFIIVIFCICCVIFAGKFIVQGGKILSGSLGKTTVKTVSKKLGEEMKKDEYGNVNVLIVGIGGQKHQGGYLSDTMIIASWDPVQGNVTMLSIPRDLYVAGSGYAGRINGLFARGHSQGGTLGSGAEMLIDKFSQMFDIKIPYYVIADFQGFKDVIDALGGIDIYVPESINDYTYPDSGIGYEPFHITVGDQHLDGETALKYARSRHTTSDFSRSQRQQEIIKAVIKESLKKENITNVTTLKELYNTYSAMVTTNISSKEIIGMVRYVYDFKNIFSFGLNTRCTYSSYKLTDAGCFLYTPNRDAFNGASVLLPNGGTNSTISFYTYFQNFSNLIFREKGYLQENARITIKNAIDKAYASSKGKSPSGWANKVAVKLKKYGFNLAGAENSDQFYDKTTAVVYGDDYDETIKVLKRFIPIDNVITGQTLNPVESENSEYTGEDLQNQFDLGYDIELYIGNDFIDYVNNSGFSYEI